MADKSSISDLSLDSIFNAVEKSLARLGTPYIDVLQIHLVDTTVPFKKIMKPLHDLVQAGKYRYLGASSMWTYQLHSCSLMRKKLDGRSFSMNGEQLARPFGKGDSIRATTPHPMTSALTDAEKEIINRVERFSGDSTWSMSVLSLASLKAKGAVPIVGFDSVSTVGEAAGLRGESYGDQHSNCECAPYPKFSGDVLRKERCLSEFDGTVIDRDPNTT
ncbi:hypothetical protein DPSP01_009422 [Paraphaeosphaeria sporulosa]